MSDMNESHQEIKPRRHRFPWFKFFSGDYVDGTRELSLAARGAYCDILHALYSRGGPVPNDNTWIACYLHASPRHWRKIRDELFASGKLTLSKDGKGITNPRAEREDYGRKAAATATKKRPLPRPKLGPVFRVSLNKIKDRDSTESESESEERKKESISTVQNHIHVPASQGLAGLNGSADPMLRDIVRWMSGGDEVSARNWLATQVRVYGETVVGDAYAKLNTDLASGKPVAWPLRAWCGIAQRLKDGKTAPPKQTAREKYLAEQERAMRIAMGERP